MTTPAAIELGDLIVVVLESGSRPPPPRSGSRRCGSAASTAIWNAAAHAGRLPIGGCGGRAARAISAPWCSASRLMCSTRAAIGYSAYGPSAGPHGSGQPRRRRASHAGDPGVVVVVEQRQAAGRRQRPVDVGVGDVAVAEVAAGAPAEDADRDVAHAPGDRRERRRVGLRELVLDDRVAGADGRWRPWPRPGGGRSSNPAPAPRGTARRSASRAAAAGGCPTGTPVGRRSSWVQSMSMAATVRSNEDRFWSWFGAEWSLMDELGTTAGRLLEVLVAAAGPAAVVGPRAGRPPRGHRAHRAPRHRAPAPARLSRRSPRPASPAATASGRAGGRCHR